MMLAVMASSAPHVWAWTFGGVDSHEWSFSTPYSQVPTVPAPTSPIGQMGGGQGGQLGPPTMLGMRVVPSLTIAERYDSNVFYAPDLPGLKRQDYVSTVSPGVSVIDARSTAVTTFTVGAVGEFYAVNRGLNYVGLNAGLNLDLNHLIRRYVPNAKLVIRDTFSFTPQPPAFIGGEPVGPPPSADTVPPEDRLQSLYQRGIQAYRVNSYNNQAGINIGVPVSARTQLGVGYSHQLQRFGSAFIQTARAPILFSSDTHAVNASSTTQVSSFDSFTASYAYSLTQYEGARMDQHTGSIGWARVLSRQWSGGVTGGASLVRMRGLGSGDPDIIGFTGGASLSWKEGPATVSLNYSAGIFPSYFVAAGPMVSHNIGVTASTQPWSNQFQASASVSYARNEILGEQQDTGVFESYFTSESLLYKITPTVNASLIHTFGLFMGNFGFGAGSGSISRNTVMLSLSMYWP